MGIIKKGFTVLRHWSSFESVVLNDVHRWKFHEVWEATQMGRDQGRILTGLKDSKPSQCDALFCFSATSMNIIISERFLMLFLLMLLLLRIMNVYQWISPTNGKVLPGPPLYNHFAGRGEVMLCLVSFFPRVFKRGKQGNPVYMEVLMGKIIYQCWIFQQAMFDDTRKYPTLIPWLVHSYPITIPTFNIVKPYERHYFRDTFSH